MKTIKIALTILTLTLFSCGNPSGLKYNDIVTINSSVGKVECYCRVVWIKHDGTTRLHCKNGSIYEANVDQLEKCAEKFNPKDFNWGNQ